MIRHLQELYPLSDLHRAGGKLLARLEGSIEPP
jgi:hypothetical protein